MRALFLLCITTACMAAVVMGSTCPTCDQDKVTPEMKARMQANGQKLNKLIARAVGVSETITKRNKERQDAELQAMNMLQKLESRNGLQCKGRFVCGGAAHQCVENLVVCDGANDCDNGADESDNVCTNPGRPGSTFEGVTVWDKCTRREPYKVAMDFISEERSTSSKYSNLFVNVRLRMSYSHKGTSGEDSLPMKGLYYPGLRTIEFGAPEDDRLGVTVEFPIGENDVMIAYAVREASGTNCAKFLLKRQ